MDIVEHPIPDLKTQQRAPASNASTLQQLSSRLSAQDLHSPLTSLPTEIKFLITNTLRNPTDLVSLTHASLSYHCVAVRYNRFTASALQELEDRDISLLPRHYSFPEAFTAIALTVKRESQPAPYMWTALREYLRQYIQHQQKEKIRLSVRHCLALQEILDVCRWFFMGVDVAAVLPASDTRTVPNSEESHAVAYGDERVESSVIKIRKDVLSESRIDKIKRIRWAHRGFEAVTVAFERRDLVDEDES